MTQLLVIREYIKNFYTKYEEFIVPLLKFVLGFILFLTINGRMGYMEKIDHVAIVLVAALLCSFLPLGVMVFLSAMFLLLHTYALSVECVVVLLLAYIIVLVIYLRFAPKAHLLLLLTPLLFVWKIPYAAPLAAGLFGTPGAAAAVAGGVVVYYVLAYITGNAQAFGGGESDTMLQRFSDMGTGVIENKEMLIVVTAFAITAILVYAIRRMSINYSRAIAVLVGTLADIVILLIGDLIYDANFSLAGVILGSIVCALIALVMQFFQFNLDYARTEKVQFEDDEYYYYVKAVPKMAVAVPKIVRWNNGTDQRVCGQISDTDTIYRTNGYCGDYPYFSDGLLSTGLYSEYQGMAAVKGRVRHSGISCDCRNPADGYDPLDCEDGVSVCNNCADRRAAAGAAQGAGTARTEKSDPFRHSL